MSVKCRRSIDVFPQSTIFANNISHIGNFIPIWKQMLVIFQLGETDRMRILNKLLDISIDFIAFLLPLSMPIFLLEHFLILLISLVVDCALLMHTFVLLIIQKYILKMLAGWLSLMVLIVLASWFLIFIICLEVLRILRKILFVVRSLRL